MLTWDDIIRDCKILAKQIKTCDAIVAIGRGGFVPGTILSYTLDTTLTTFIIKSYKNYTSNTAEIIQPPDEIFLKKYKYKNIVIIDDLSDRGETLRAAETFFMDKGFTNLNFATLYIKKTTKFAPDYYVTEFDDNLWLDFPWEIC